MTAGSPHRSRKGWAWADRCPDRMSCRSTEQPRRHPRREVAGSACLLRPTRRPRPKKRPHSACPAPKCRFRRWPIPCTWSMPGRRGHRRSRRRRCTIGRRIGERSSPCIPAALPAANRRGYSARTAWSERHRCIARSSGSGRASRPHSPHRSRNPAHTLGRRRWSLRAPRREKGRELELYLCTCQSPSGWEKHGPCHLHTRPSTGFWPSEQSEF